MPLFIHLTRFHDIYSFDSNVFVSRFIHSEVNLSKSTLSNILQNLIVFQFRRRFLLSTLALWFGLVHVVGYILIAGCSFLKLTRWLFNRQTLTKLRIIFLIKDIAKLLWLLWICVHSLEHCVHLSGILCILLYLLLLIVVCRCRIRLHLNWLKFLKKI